LGNGLGIALQGVSPAVPKPSSPIIVERDDGLFQLGWRDAAPSLPEISPQP
jgi:hypothetical protein